jgi:hypothetical protein
MFLGSKVRWVRKADNLTAIYDNVGSLTSHNPIGLQGLLRDSFTFLLYLNAEEEKLVTIVKIVECLSKLCYHAHLRLQKNVVLLLLPPYMFSTTKTNKQTDIFILLMVEN